MARISLLFSLALALALALAAASASAHKPPIKSKSVSAGPTTVGELKTIPFAEVKKLIDAKESSAPKTPEFAVMLSACKTYVSFLSAYAKRGDFEVPGFDSPTMGKWKAKLAAMNQVVMTAHKAFSSAGGGKASLALNKNYEGMMFGFVAVPTKVGELSLRHKFDPAAKLSPAEQKAFNSVFRYLKKSINGYLNICSEIATKKQVATGGESWVNPSASGKKDSGR